MPHTPPMGFNRYFQMNTMAPPEIIPASTPHLVVRFQNRAVSMAGAKVAPKPAHAKDTMVNTELLGSRARNTAMIEMTMTVTRATHMVALLDIFTPKTSFTRSSETLEEAASSWLSAVDMVEARMPAMIRPAANAASTPWVLSRSAILTITASAALEEPKVSISPTFDMARPVIPMVTATVMEMTTQMLPMRREILIFLASLMPMKRSRMWGMPK